MLLLYLSIFLSYVYSQTIPPYTTYYFKQTLDHFDPQNTQTFQERYLVYDKVFNKDRGVIFFYAGNEGDVTAFWNNTGFMFDIASEFNALVIFAEHRFYGETLPFGDNSFTRASLKYLTIENAIADYAVLMTSIKQTLGKPNIPIIVFGGSYGGILSALCRIHYPDIFSMSLAASAPIPQTLNTVNGYEFFKLVTQDYYNVDTRCPDIVRQGYAQMLELANEGKYKEIQNIFNLCSTPKNADDINLLQLWSRNGFLTMAMVDYPYAADFLGSLPANPVNVSCDMMIGNKNNPMQAIALGSGLFYNASNDYELTCYDLSTEFIECADQTGCGLGNDAISWDYQMCTEIVYAMDTNNKTDMFIPYEWNLNNLTEYCNNKYGVTPEPEWMQVWFPLDVADASTNIIFSNGLLDPWHGGGYLYSLGPTLPAIIIPSGAHHLDLRSKNINDPSDVTKARQMEVNYFNEWLKNLNKTNKINSNKYTGKHFKTVQF